MGISKESRVLGCLNGIGIGDALGVPSSFLSPTQIKANWGWIDTFYPPADDHIFHAGLKAGEYTDDTEQSLAVLNSYIRNCRVEPIDVVKEIMGWAKRVENKYASPLGPSTERALKAIVKGGDIQQTGRYANTNGSAMRIAPLGILHGLRESSLAELVEDVYLTGLPTHNTTVCNAAASAVAYGIALCIQGVTDIGHIIEGTIKAAEVGSQKGFSIVSPSVAKRIDFIYEMVLRSTDPRKTMQEMYDLFGGGDLAGDSIPVAIGLFALGKAVPKDVIEYSVNFGGDADTNGAIAGAMAGAYAGVEALPSAWIHTVAETNGVDFASYANQIFELVPKWN